MMNVGINKQSVGPLLPMPGDKKIDAQALGMGVAINLLSGSGLAETYVAIKSSEGKTISALRVESDTLEIQFTDGSTINIWDGGQSCCESRYMTVDDNLQEFVGAIFLGAETRESPSESSEYGTHDIQFLVVDTNLGAIVIRNHNEHNGYYGGFWIQAAIRKNK